MDVAAYLVLPAGYDRLVSELRMVLPHGAPAAPVRQRVGDALRKWGVPQCAADVLLVCTELVQNVTQHTAGDGELRLLLGADSILVEVSDSSPSLPSLSDVDLRRVGGRGLRIVAAIAVAWGSRSATWDGHFGKVVWAEFALAPVV